MKENQPDLLAAIMDAFDDQGVSPRERRLAEAERQTATSFNKGHGRMERRTLTSTTGLSDGYVDWPGLGQGYKLVRERTLHGKTTVETVFGITSLNRDQADAGRLLRLTRQHWGIENKVFYVRDMSFGEDACRIRSGSAPYVVSCLRNMGINLLNRCGLKNKAAAIRRHAAHPEEALALLSESG